MKKLEEIKRILSEHKAELRTRYGVKAIGVYGSYVKGEEGEESDVDVLVEFEPETRIGLLKFVNLEDYLGTLLGVKVDLVMKSALKPRIGKRILREVVYL